MKLIDREKLLARLEAWEAGARRDAVHNPLKRPAIKLAEYKGEANALKSLIVQIKAGDFDAGKKEKAEQTYFGPGYT